MLRFSIAEICSSSADMGSLVAVSITCGIGLFFEFLFVILSVLYFDPGEMVNNYPLIQRTTEG